MAARRGDAERTKAAILESARRLFSEHNYKRVTMRDIAADAGVNHALVHRYFGTKEDVIHEILRREIDEMRARYAGGPLQPLETIEDVRAMLTRTLTMRHDMIQLVVRSELAEFQPEKMLDEDFVPLERLVDWIARQQSLAPQTDAPRKDPALVASIAGAGVFAFGSMSPWLMMIVGLKPEDYPLRQQEIIDLLVAFVAEAAGVSQDGVGGAAGHDDATDALASD